MAAHQAPPSLGFSRQEHWEWVAISFPSAWKWKRSCSVLSNSPQPQGLQATRLLHPWDFPGKSTGVGCHCLLLTPIWMALNLQELLSPKSKLAFDCQWDWYQAFLGTDPPTHMFPHLFFIKKKKKTTLASLAFPKFQRANLIREMEKMQKKKESSQAGQNYSLATKQNQGLLVPLQGLQIIPWATSLSCFTDSKNSYQVEAVNHMLPSIT